MSHSEFTDGLEKHLPTRRSGGRTYRGRYFEGKEGVPVGAGVDPYKYRFFAGPASQAEGEHALDMCSNAFSGGFRGSLSKKPILVSHPIHHPLQDFVGE